MKKLLLSSFVALLTVFTASSQTFQWTTPQTVEENLAQNTTVQFPLHQQAIGTDTVTLGIEIIYNDIPQTWDGMVCIYGSCLGIIPPVGTTAEMTPISGTTEGMVRLTVNPMSGTEVAKLQVYVFDIDFPNDGDTATFLLNTTLGIDAMNMNDVSLSVFPNPSASEVVVESAINMKSVAIIDAQGRVVGFEKNLNSTSHHIDVQSLPVGHYVIQIEDVNGLHSNKKFVKK